MRRPGLSPLLASFFVLLAAVVAPFSAAPSASSLPAPEGPVILTVTGDIARTNGDGRAAFDYAMLEALGLEELRTVTPYSEGEPVFRGVLFGDLLDAVGARGSRVRASALDRYEAEIAIELLERYDVLIALEQDGRRLSRRGKGPAWIVFPFGRHPELDSEKVRAQSVWQLATLEVR